MISIVLLLAWPAWRMLRGRWVEVSTPDGFDHATLTYADGTTSEFAYEAMKERLR